MNDSPNEKGPGGNRSPLENTKPTSQFKAKSTATHAQYQRVLCLLRSGKKSTIEFRKAGIMSPASRIKELNDRYGYNIPTIERINLWDDEGFMHAHVAVYELHEEPKGAA